MITMQTDLSEFRLYFNDSISNLKDKDQARDLDGAVFGSLYWNRRKLNKEVGVKKEISRLKKIKRLIANKIKNLPDKMDRYGNTMVSTTVFSMDSFLDIATSVGAINMNWNNGFTAVYSGPNVALTYCEGSVVIYRGSNAQAVVNDNVRFWLNEC